MRDTCEQVRHTMATLRDTVCCCTVWRIDGADDPPRGSTSHRLGQMRTMRLRRVTTTTLHDAEYCTAHMSR